MTGAGGSAPAFSASFSFRRPMPKLVLVDGSSYLYRAFHALPDLRTSRGERMRYVVAKA